MDATQPAEQRRSLVETLFPEVSAAIGLPYMARQTVAGSVETLTPAVDYDTLVTVLQRHTDLTAANLRIASSRNSLRLAEVQPEVRDK